MTRATDGRRGRLGLVVGLVCAASLCACVEQSRERKKYGRTFESSRTGAYMPFEFAPVPEGRWVDTSTEWKTSGDRPAVSAR